MHIQVILFLFVQEQQQLGTESAARAAKAFSEYIRAESSRLQTGGQVTPRSQRHEDIDEEDEIEVSL